MSYLNLTKQSVHIIVTKSNALVISKMVNINTINLAGKLQTTKAYSQDRK